MKFLLQIILIIGLGFILQLFFPFWVISIVGFASALGFRYRKALAPFLAAFLGGLLLWGGMAYYQNLPNDGQLAERVSALMGFGGVWTLIILTGVLGGLLAALGSLSGYFLRDLFQGQKKPSA
ncbi:MAG: hypothetical protein KDC34_11105 [Saprospiraceae bacterium]|nr:hypothetical protein [Saprospiraceae bacterium]